MGFMAVEALTVLAMLAAVAWLAERVAPSAIDALARTLRRGDGDDDETR